MTISPAVLAIASMVIQSLADCLYKRGQVRGIVPESFLVFQSYSFGLTAFLFMLVQGAFRSDLTAWKYGPVCGLLAFGAFYLFLTSLKEGQVSVNTLIFRMSFVLTTILAVSILDEGTDLYMISGLVAAVLAVSCMTVLPTLIEGPREIVAGTRLQATAKQLTFPLLAFVCLGFLSFLYKVAAEEGIPSSTLIFIQFAFFSPLAMTYAAVRRRFQWHPPSAIHGLGAGILLSTALILLVCALARGEAGVIVPVYQMSFALTAILAVRWFGETWAASKTAGVILATGAVLLLSIDA